MEKIILRREVMYIEFKLADNEGRNRDTVERLRTEFLNDFNKGHTNFWIDVKRINNINSLFVGALAYIAEKLDSYGKIVIEGASDQVRDIIKKVEGELNSLKQVKFVEVIDP